MLFRSAGITKKDGTKFTIKEATELSLDMGVDMSLTCFHCGAHTMNAKLIEGEITLLGFEDVGKGKWDYVPLEECTMPEYKPYSVRIDIPSGKMLVSNFFRGANSITKEVKHHEDYSINMEAGRIKTTNLYADNGVVNFSTGNCGCSFFKDNDEENSFVVNQGWYAEETEYDVGSEDEKIYLTHQARFNNEVADVCCDYWGFQVVDHDLFFEKGYDVEQDGKYQTIECEAGTYEFTNYYKVQGDENDNYATIKKVK